MGEKEELPISPVNLVFGGGGGGAVVPAQPSIICFLLAGVIFESFVRLFCYMNSNLLCTGCCCWWNINISVQMGEWRELLSCTSSQPSISPPSRSNAWSKIFPVQGLWQQHLPLRKQSVLCKNPNNPLMLYQKWSSSDSSGLPFYSAIAVSCRLGRPDCITSGLIKDPIFCLCLPDSH